MRKILFVLCLSIITISQFPINARASNEWVVSKDYGDFESISEAITESAEGDTILVERGEYESETIMINKQLIIRSKDGFHMTYIIARYNACNLFEINSDNVVIEGFTLLKTSDSSNNNCSAIYLKEVSNCKILNNKSSLDIEDNDFEMFSNGIYLKNSSENIISGNTFQKNQNYGILLENSNNNIITENISKMNQKAGIYLNKSVNNFIYFNNFIDNFEDHPYYDTSVQAEDSQPNHWYVDYNNCPNKEDFYCPSVNYYYSRTIHSSYEYGIGNYYSDHDLIENYCYNGICGDDENCHSNAGCDDYPLIGDFEIISPVLFVRDRSYYYPDLNYDICGEEYYFNTIQEAVNIAKSMNTIIVNGEESYYDEDNTYRESIIINKPMSLIAYLEPDEYNETEASFKPVISPPDDNDTYNAITVLSNNVKIEGFEIYQRIHSGTENKNDYSPIINNLTVLKCDCDGIFLGYHTEYCYIVENISGYVAIESNYSQILSNTVGGGGIYGENIIIASNIFEYNLVLNSNNNIVFNNKFHSCKIRFDDADYNRIYLNSFQNTTDYFDLNGGSYIRSNYLRSPIQLHYTYNDKELKQHMGNYYDNHDNMDLNENGIRDQPLIKKNILDYYPLVKSNEHYSLNILYLYENKIQKGNTFKPYKKLLINDDNESYLFVSPNKFHEEKKFSGNDIWSGQIYTIQNNDSDNCKLSLEIGSFSAWYYDNGQNFSEEGFTPLLSTTVDCSQSENYFSFDANPLTITSGNHLAVRIQRKDYDDCTILTGGLFCYIIPPIENPSIPDPPYIKSVSPKKGFVSGGQQVVLTGIRLNDIQDSGFVLFGDVQSNHYTKWSNDEIIMAVPPNQIGIVDIIVTTSNGLSYSLSNAFTYLPLTLTVGISEPYTTIQSAVDASINGNTIVVRQGTYIENVIVDKSISILSESGYESVTVVAVKDESAFSINADNVVLKGFTIFGTNNSDSAAIKLDSTSHCIISKNRCGGENKGFNIGIQISASWWSSAKNNVVSNNLCNYNSVGIKGLTSESNIYNNICNYNSVGIEIRQSENIIHNNNCKYNNTAGIIIRSSNNEILNNKCNNNLVYGMQLVYSDNNSLSSNVFNINNVAGMHLKNSDNNSLLDNVFQKNQTAISIHDSNQNIFNRNLLEKNNDKGLYINNSKYNNIIDNEILQNNDAIYNNSSENIFMKNIISSNSQYGIFLSENSSKNIIYLNNFIDNSQAHIFSKSQTSNILNSPSPICYTYNNQKFKSYVGNYYSDQTNLEDEDDDGIGDTYLQIPESKGFDKSPLLSSIENYEILMWFLTQNGALSLNNYTTPIALVSVNYDNRIWKSESVFKTLVEYGDNDAWSGQIFNSLAEKEIQIGIVNEYSYFQSIGPKANISEDGIFMTSKTAFDVTPNTHLAIKLGYSYYSDNDKIYIGGAWSYISEPAGQPGKPNILSIDPQKVLEKGLTSITINGANFGNEKGSIYFGNEKANQIDTWSQNQIVCKAPPHGPGLVEIKVITTSGQLALFTAFEYLPETINVGPSREIKNIQAAVDHSLDGQTIIVDPGIYNENIVINTSLILESAEGYEYITIIAEDNSKDALLVNKDNTTVRGFTVYGANDDYNCHAIKVNASKCLIENNRCGYTSEYQNYHGIEVKKDNNTICNNICIHNKGFGISVSGSNNVVYNNKCNYNDFGISTSGSNNAIDNNECNNNQDTGISIGCCHHHVTRNVCIGNESGISIGGSYNSVNENTFSNNNYGLTIHGSKNNFFNNTIQNNNIGTEIGDYYCIANSFTKNAFISNSTGISAKSARNNFNQILQNIFLNNTEYGIILENGYKSSIYLNNFINNSINNESSKENLFSPSAIYHQNDNNHFSKNYLGNYYSNISISDSIEYSLSSGYESYTPVIWYLCDNKEMYKNDPSRPIKSLSCEKESYIWFSKTKAEQEYVFSEKDGWSGQICFDMLPYDNESVSLTLSIGTSSNITDFTSANIKAHLNVSNESDDCFQFLTNAFPLTLPKEEYLALQIDFNSINDLILGGASTYITPPGDTPTIPIVFSVNFPTVLEGNTVVLNGTGFGDEQGSGNIYFGSAPVTQYINWNNNSIHFIAPEQSVGSVDITVTTNIGAERCFSELLYYNPIEIYVGKNEKYQTIQSAINDARNGNIIIVKDGTYIENIGISKSITLRSEGNYNSVTLISKNSDKDTIYISNKKVTIDGLTIFGSEDYDDAGIYLNDKADYCTIINNRCGLDKLHKNYNGIIVRSNYNFINSNICNFNSDGIILYGSNNNRIIANTCSNNDDGLALYSKDSGYSYIYSGRNIIINNILSNNRRNGLNISKGSENIVVNNLLTNNNNGLNNFDFNIFYFNDFSTNTNNVLSETEDSKDSTWQSPVQINFLNNTYLHKSYLGNYYSDHDLQDSDKNYIADQAYSIKTQGIDNYPLTHHTKNYIPQLLYLNNNNVLSINNPLFDYSEIILKKNESIVWITENSSSKNLIYPDSGMWEGLITIKSTNSVPDSLSIQIGKTTDQKTFLPAGPTSTFTKTTHYMQYIFQADAQAFTVLSGEYLAVSITNNSASDYTICLLNLLSFISLPKNSPQFFQDILYVGGVGYDHIQTAINNAKEGSTIIVRDGIYEENLVIDKPLIIKSQSGPKKVTIIAKNTNDHAFEISADNVNIEGFFIKGVKGNQCAGIFLNNVKKCHIHNIHLYDNQSGMIIKSSNENYIYNNIVASNQIGIQLDSSMDNVIYQNDFLTNTLSNVQSVNMSKNRWYSSEKMYYYWEEMLQKNFLGNYYSNHQFPDNNMDGIVDTAYNLPEDEPDDLYPLTSVSSSYSVSYHIVGDGHLDSIQEAIDSAQEGSIIVVEPGIYKENLQINSPIKIISASGYQSVTVIAKSQGNHAFWVSSNNVHIEGFSIYGASQDSKAAIYLDPLSSNCTIINNRCGKDTIFNNFYGIYIDQSDHNLISTNICNFNEREGIFLEGSSENIIIDNNCLLNKANGIELITLDLYSGRILYANKNIIVNNICNMNSYNGIRLSGSSENVISENTFKANTLNGISLYTVRSISGNNIFINSPVSQNNNIFLNRISENQYGISLSNSKDNFVYMNSFEQNNNTIKSESIDPDKYYNIWNTQSKMYYSFNENIFTSILGNYYSDHNNSDINGDGIAENMYVVDSEKYNDTYPLSNSLDKYHISIFWFGNKNVLSDNLRYISGSQTLEKRSFAIWIADKPEDNESVITEWTGMLTFNEAMFHHQPISIDIGYSTNGEDYHSCNQEIVSRGDGEKQFVLYEANNKSCTIPSGKHLTIKIINNSNSTYSLQTGALSYISFPESTPGPKIESVTPKFGSISGNIPITIQGEHFGSSPGTVMFGNNEVNEIHTWLDEIITCTLPSSATEGFVDITVTTENNFSSKLKNGFQYKRNRTIIVEPDQSIQDAIDEAIDFDTIEVKDGEYKEQINFNGKNIIVKSVNGPQHTYINGENCNRVVVFDSKVSNDARLEGFTVLNGKAYDGGGVSITSGAAPTISKCIIKDNYASGYGGAIYCYNASPKLINCIIFKNSAKYDGDAIYSALSSLEIVHCTITHNNNQNGVAIVARYSSSSLKILNSILWNNGQQIQIDNNVEISVEYSNIEGGYTGTYNINALPKYISSESDNFHILWDSPCIDKGKDNSVTTDIDYESRPVNNGFDIGADEVLLDNIPPTTSFSTEGIFYLENNIYYVKSGFSLSFTATDQESGLEKIVFQLNSENFQEYEDPLLFSQEGTYTIIYKAIDNADNSETENVLTITVDHTSPATPTNFSGTFSNNTISLQWSANTESDFSSYNIYKQNVLLKTGLTSTHYVDEAINANQYYVYYISALDRLGNESTYSERVIISTMSDEIYISNPIDNTFTVEPIISINGFTYPESKVQLFINEKSYTFTNSYETGEFIFTNIQLAEGENAITAVMINTSGELGTPTAPILIHYIKPPDPPTGINTSPGDTIIQVNWNENTEPDILGYYIYRNNERLLYQFEPITKTSFTDTRLSNGKTYTYAVTCIDSKYIESNQSNPIRVTPVAGDWKIQTKRNKRLSKQPEMIHLNAPSQNNTTTIDVLNHRSPLTSRKITVTASSDELISFTDGITKKKQLKAGQQHAFVFTFDINCTSQNHNQLINFIIADDSGYESTITKMLSIHTTLNKCQSCKNNQIVSITCPEKDCLISKGCHPSSGCQYFQVESAQCNIDIGDTGHIHFIEKNNCGTVPEHFFSPGSIDGQKDILPIEISLNETSNISVGIYKTNGDWVTSLVHQQSMESGKFSAEWDGQDADETIMEDGLYHLIITKDNQVTKQHIHIDNDSPVSHISNIIQQSAGYIEIYGIATDPNIYTANILCLSCNETVFDVFMNPLPVSDDLIAIINTSEMNAKEYTICLKVSDKAGNESMEIKKFNVHPSSGVYTYDNTISPGYQTFTDCPVIWVEDVIPESSQAIDKWEWETDTRYSGIRSHTNPTKNGVHGHYFIRPDNPLYLAEEDHIVQYVYLSSEHPPLEILLQFYTDKGNGEHRAYWGKNLIQTCGIQNSASLRFMGELPGTGAWIRLTIPASQLDLAEKQVRGIAYVAYNGKVWWDRTTKTSTIDDSGLDYQQVSQLSSEYHTSATIKYQVVKSEHITITVYQKENLIKRLVDIAKEPGVYQVLWDWTDSKANAVSDGTYNVRMTTSSGNTDLGNIVVNNLTSHIRFPYDNTLLAGEVPIIGAASAKDFEYFIVEYASAEDPNHWILLNRSYQQAFDMNQWFSKNNQSNANLATWSIDSSSTMGPHTIRLQVFNKQGNMKESSVMIDVAKTVDINGGMLKSDDNAVCLTIPENALSTKALISIVPLEWSADWPIPDNFVAIGQPYVIKTSNFMPSKATSLEMSYQMTGAIDEKTFRIYQWQPNQQLWAACNSTIKTTQKQLMLNLRFNQCKVTAYAILSGPIVSPFVYGPVYSSGNQTHLFGYSFPGASIEIFKNDSLLTSVTANQINGLFLREITVTDPANTIFQIRTYDIEGNFSDFVKKNLTIISSYAIKDVKTLFSHAIINHKVVLKNIIEILQILSGHQNKIDCHVDFDYRDDRKYGLEEILLIITDFGEQ